MNFGFGGGDKNWNIIQSNSGSAAKKYKALSQFLIGLTKSDDGEQQKLKSYFIIYCDQVFAICINALNRFDNTAKVKGSSYKEIEEILETLLKLFRLLQDEIMNHFDKDKDNIYLLLTKTLRHKNKDEIRKIGFQILLIYINHFETNKMPIEIRLLKLFESSLNYEEIKQLNYGECDVKNIPDKISLNEEGWLKIVRKEEQIMQPMASYKIFFEIFQHWMDKFSKNSECWFAIFKKYWISYFYPLIYCKYIQKNQATSSDFGFQPFCPPRIHVLVVQLLLKIFRNENLRNIIFDQEENFRLAREIFFHTFRDMKTLVKENTEVIYRIKFNILGLYNEWLSDKSVPSSIHEHKNQFILEIIEGLFKVFHPELQNEQTKSSNHDQLCESVTTIIEKYLEKHESRMEDEFSRHFWEHLENIIYSQLQNYSKIYSTLYMNMGVGSSSGPSTSALIPEIRLLFSHYITVISHFSERGFKVNWDKLEQVTNMFMENDGFILSLQQIIIMKTKTLLGNILNIPNNEETIILENEMSPFKGAEMRREYILQLFVEAYYYKGATDGEKYEIVKSCGLYRIFEIWVRLINIMNCMIGIKSRTAFVIMMRGLCNIVDCLLKYGKKAMQNKLVLFPPPPNTLLRLFGSQIFKICESQKSEHIEGKKFGYQILCKILCQTKCEIPISQTYLSHIVRLLYEGLNTKFRDYVAAIIRNSKKIFLLDYRGMNLLIPTYVEYISIVLEDSSFPYDVKSSALSILGSLLCLPNHYPGLKLPRINSTTHYIPPYSMQEMKLYLKSNIISILNQPLPAHVNENYAKFVKKGICCATVLVYEEMSWDKRPLDEIIIWEDAFLGVAKKCIEGDTGIACFALSCFSSMSFLFSLIYKHCGHSIGMAMEMLSSKLHQLITQASRTLISVHPSFLWQISSLLHCLLEWISEDRYTYFVRSKGVFDQIIETCDSIIKCKNESVTEEVRDDAVYFLSYIREFYGNFPLKKQDVSVMGSMFNEADFLNLEQDTLASHQQLTKVIKQRSSTSYSPKKKSDEEISSIRREILNTPMRGAPRKKSFSMDNLNTVIKTEEMNELIAAEQNKEHSEGSNPSECSMEKSDSFSSKFYERLKKLGNYVVKNILNKECEDLSKSGEFPTALSKSSDKQLLGNLRERTVYLRYKDESIISIMESPHLSARIIIRDLTGKHGWVITEHRVLNFDPMTHLDYNDKVSVMKNIFNLRNDTLLKKRIVDAKDERMYDKLVKMDGIKMGEIKGDEDLEVRQEGELEAINNNNTQEETKTESISISEPGDDYNIETEEQRGTAADADSDDILRGIMDSLCGAYEDAQSLRDYVKNWEDATLREHQHKLNLLAKRSHDKQNAEASLHPFSKVNVHFANRDAQEFESDLSQFSELYESGSLVDHARGFLFHLGLFDIFEDNQKPQLEKLSSDNEHFMRMMDSLDKHYPFRKSIRVGVIFVDKGQFEQKSILFNYGGTPQYENFLHKLGNVIDGRKVMEEELQSHTVYFANGLYELIFHVPSLMPTNYSDDQQIEKKKYVGNDLIHIVWNENEREYMGGTISGAFNFAHIVIHQMKNGLYRIQIAKKEDTLKFFGPLFNGMVVPFQILAPLIRYTAINARKSLVNKNYRIVHPITQRRKQIQDIIKWNTPQNHTQVSLLDKLFSS